MRKCLQHAFLLLMLFASMPAVLHAQQKTITGTVLDNENNPVSGVTVSVKDANRATTTNADGRYSILASQGQVLEFTFVGYQTVTSVVGAGNSINITLQPSDAALEEVVITAEFGMKRIGRAVGSSIQVVDGNTINESGRDAFISSLQGRVPGLNVSSTSGAPGASNTVVLRNITSISGNNQPLYVVDG